MESIKEEKRKNTIMIKFNSINNNNMYRKYKDGSYSIPKEFIQIIIKPTQAVIDAIGLDYKIKEKINDDVTNDLVELCDSLPEKFG